MIDPVAVGGALLGAPVKAAVPLVGGLLNHVWRLTHAGGTAVLKHAPPHVASSPDIPLSASRSSFEAAALALLGGPLAVLCDDTLRPPRLLAHDPDRSVILMEDLGPGRSLLAAPEHAGAVGTFIGRLHAATRGDADLATRFHNLDIQRTRLVVQYAPVADRLAEAGVAEAAEAGAIAVALGERLCRPGVCLVMGDLWPPSVWCTDAGVRLIDWEMAHYGQPAQDVAHLVAHLWMAGLDEAQHRFLAAYFAAAGPLSVAEQRDCQVHFGAEVLARSLGPFAREGGDTERLVLAAVDAICGRGGDRFARGAGD